MTYLLLITLLYCITLVRSVVVRTVGTVAEINSNGDTVQYCITRDREKHKKECWIALHCALLILKTHAARSSPLYRISLTGVEKSNNATKTKVVQ